MNLNERFTSLLFLILPIVIFAQAETIFNDVRLNESLETVKKN
jgi:hypothetical protein